MFLSIWIGICLRLAFTISIIDRSWDRNFLLRSYMVSNNLMVYTWYIPEYARYKSGLYWFWFYYWLGMAEQDMMKLQSLLRTGMYRSLLRRGTSHHHWKSMFYSAVINARHNPGIYLSYLYSSNLCGPCESSRRAGMFQTWTVCESFPFLRPKALQLEAGACQSSTASCWSHKHGCPCVMQGLDRWHPQI